MTLDRVRKNPVPRPTHVILPSAQDPLSKTLRSSTTSLHGKFGQRAENDGTCVFQLLTAERLDSFLFDISHLVTTMSLNIAVSIPLSIATSVHQSSDFDTGSLDLKIQSNIIRSIVSAVKSLPDDSSTWSLDTFAEEEEEEHKVSGERQNTPSSSPSDTRVCFSDTDTFIPIQAAPSLRSIRKRRSSSLKETTSHHHQPAIALQKPSGPDIAFPGANFAFEIRQGHSRSLAVAAHGAVTTAELALAIWRVEGVPMREQKLFLGDEELYNGRVHERDGIYELMKLRGKFVSTISCF